MKAERLVIDSNVWIAALISPSGTARQLVDAVLDNDIDILMSEATFTELVSRLDRPKFDRYREPEAWNLFLSELVELALWLEDAGTATGISRDPDDDKFLALAVIGRADAIISGDRDLLELVAHEGIPILTPAQFMQRVSYHQSR
ncbi:MAG: putative toxin-antitoxin system toxin component, PIN family [Gammaproteobacteria bacterium]|nr:putative toxin-antitoxin system toxin component, PIN family [Gammaproteobacteria bacterium]MCP5139089.1 putative toxin-antitoxin system toxin component, PIN family [Chromatiales bacterium]